jgi:hypothetical protein
MFRSVFDTLFYSQFYSITGKYQQGNINPPTTDVFYVDSDGNQYVDSDGNQYVATNNS